MGPGIWFLSSVPYKDLKIKLMLTWLCKFSKAESFLQCSTSHQDSCHHFIFNLHIFNVLDKPRSFPPVYLLYSHYYDPHTLLTADVWGFPPTKQFWHQLGVLQFNSSWHSLPGDGLRSYRLRAQSCKSVPSPFTGVAHRTQRNTCIR